MSCDEIEVPVVKKTEGRIPILTLLGNSVIGSKENFLHLEINSLVNKEEDGGGGEWRKSEAPGSSVLCM